jgi:hypothetical protein
VENPVLSDHYGEACGSKEFLGSFFMKMGFHFRW